MSMSLSYPYSLVDSPSMRRRALDEIFEFREISNFIGFLFLENFVLEGSQSKIGIFELSGNVDVVLFIVHELMPNNDIFYTF